MNMTIFMTGTVPSYHVVAFFLPLLYRLQVPLGCEADARLGI
jgi:hypothetical protein